MVGEAIHLYGEIAAILPRELGDSLTHRKGACTLTDGRGSAIRECPYQQVIPPAKPQKPAGTCPSLQQTAAKLNNKCKNK